MRLLPFLLAGPHILGVGGISADSFAVIVAAPAALAIRLAADALLWSITGRLKNLLAVSATPARTHAVLVLLRFKLRTSDQNKTGCRKNIETFVEFLPRLCRWGSQGWFTGSGLYRRNWLRLTPALTLVVHSRLLRDRQGDVSAVGPSEEARDRWTLPPRAQPDLHRGRRICSWLERYRRLPAHGRVCSRAGRWLSPARRLL